MATRREWLGLVVIVLPCLLVSMDLSVLFYALPFLSADLAPSSSQLLWILDLYGFVLAGFLITMGTLGDRIGRRKVLLAGAAVFGVASVVAAYSSSTEMLIIARALLGIGGATLAPSTLSLIRTMFTDPRERQIAVSVWTLGFAGGTLVGPVAGGFMLEHFWWGSVFLLNVPVMVALLVLGPILLPEFRNPRAAKFDLIGSVLSLAAILPVIYGVKKLAGDGFAWGYVGSILVGLAFGLLFLRRMQSSANPMIDVRLFRRAQFSGAVASGAITFLLLAGIGLFVSQYLQLVLGYSPFEAALWGLPGMAGMAFGLFAATTLATRIRPAVIVCSGLVITAAGFVLLAQVSAQSGVAWVVASNVVLAAGIGAVVTIATDLVLATVPSDSAGAAAAVSETANEFGGAAGIALLGSLGALVYRLGLPPDVPAAAQETIGSAFAVAAELPSNLGNALISTASQSFVNGMQWVAWIGAIGTVMIAGFVLVVLRHITPADQVREVRTA
ncbi:DHA2 family multidrug resistance protein-like MFS transporter [Kibdelosporangium banguiense]|uniref:DHA2 family multidrug resistance protein-like MFS transporter n=1 Tax=Kibdelosporangium banguiense TaxID=1365924 RepID=A0ABS4TMI1_9PSEU|nr:MFS transporter [Kibdelosporangium banguiense]MBP2325133.1 DHA2 family multidrug resistance protein-like MFS transporter [Kibdelosporangium banguiense]